MERPQPKIHQNQRAVTGEIVYLNEKRQQNEYPEPFSKLGAAAMRQYEVRATEFSTHSRPEIMDAYEQFDSKPSEVVTSCIALADELLLLKKPENWLTFLYISVEADPNEVLTKLKATVAGSLLAGDNEQLALSSEDGHHPKLDITKGNAKLVRAGLRAWGWDNEKYVFTNEDNEPYEPIKHVLVYPSGEKRSSRQLELFFSYEDESSGGFAESISLSLSDNGSASISRNVLVMEYLETGYEGHYFDSIQDLSDDDIAAFGDLIAEIVGDTPAPSA